MPDLKRARAFSKAISAGGSLVKFARRIRDARRLEQFSAREAGRALGRALLVDLDPDAVHVGRAHAARVPPLEAPLGAAGALPGGLSLVRVWASPALFRAVGGGLEEDVVSELQVPAPPPHPPSAHDCCCRMAGVQCPARPILLLRTIAAAEWQEYSGRSGPRLV